MLLFIDHRELKCFLHTKLCLKTSLVIESDIFKNCTDYFIWVRGLKVNYPVSVVPTLGKKRFHRTL